MLILYILLIAYIAAINFYSFLLVKALRDKERQTEAMRQAEPLSLSEPTTDKPSARSLERGTGKLCIAGLLGGSITIYVCMFIMKYRRADLLLMVLMPLLGVLNVYLWVLLFRSGFSFFVIR